MARRESSAAEGPTAADVLAALASRADPRAVEAMARFGITPASASGGLTTPELRALARRIGRDHALAQELWATGLFEARAIAAMIADPLQLTEEQAECWVADFDNWATCDGCCQDLFCKTPFAQRKAGEWCGRSEEFVKRAGFALIAKLAVHDKQAPDDVFLGYLALVEREAADERHFVKKAVNWALREIGKRNLTLNAAAIATGERLCHTDSRSARWIAADALRELRSEAVQKRVEQRSPKR
jgi:3-methyladenine DNA glycosylase AlkD